MAGNGLPPKPEERWRYIKELESRQPGVRAPTNTDDRKHMTLR
jgi:cell division protein FtsN